MIPTSSVQCLVSNSPRDGQHHIYIQTCLACLNHLRNSEFSQNRIFKIIILSKHFALLWWYLNPRRSWYFFIILKTCTVSIYSYSLYSRSRTVKSPKLSSPFPSLKVVVAIWPSLYIIHTTTTQSRKMNINFNNL